MVLFSFVFFVMLLLSRTDGTTLSQCLEQRHLRKVPKKKYASICFIPCNANWDCSKTLGSTLWKKIFHHETKTTCDPDVNGPTYRYLCSRNQLTHHFLFSGHGTQAEKINTKTDKTWSFQSEIKFFNPPHSFMMNRYAVELSGMFESGNIEKVEQQWKAKGSMKLKKGDDYYEYGLYWGKGFEYLAGIYRLSMDKAGSRAIEMLKIPKPKEVLELSKNAFRVWDIVKFIEQDEYAKKQKLVIYWDACREKHDFGNMESIVPFQPWEYQLIVGDDLNKWRKNYLKECESTIKDMKKKKVETYIPEISNIEKKWLKYMDDETNFKSLLEESDEEFLEEGRQQITEAKRGIRKIIAQQQKYWKAWCHEKVTVYNCEIKKEEYDQSECKTVHQLERDIKILIEGTLWMNSGFDTKLSYQSAKKNNVGDYYNDEYVDDEKIALEEEINALYQEKKYFDHVLDLLRNKKSGY